MYDIKLVILSILIAIIAAYTALDLAGRVTVSQGKTQTLWLVGGATAMGIGIWSTHFIGMLAYKLPIPIAYDLPTVIVSLIVPIVASLVALYLVSCQSLTKIVLFAGAIFMGFTIASMHYIGMAAMRMPAIAHYNPKLVILSVAIAITASLISLWLSFKLRQANILTDILKKIGSALIMGTGIAGMHYIGMAAVTMQPSSQLSQPGTHILASSSLAVALGIITFIILILTILTSLFEHHLDQQRNTDLIKTNEELQNEIADRIQAQIALSQANQELKQNALRFQSLVSNIPGAVYRCKCDDDWTVDFISDAIFNISGYPASDFINNCVRTYNSIIHPEDRENVKTVVQQALAQHQSYILEYRIIHPNGNIRWVYEQGQAHPSSNGNILWLDGAIFDISERKLAEEKIKHSEERFRLLVEGVKDYAILMLDPKGYITTWNTGAERIKGYQAEEIIGQHFSCFYIPEDRQNHKPERILKAAAQQGQSEEEAIRMRKDGSHFWASVLITPLYDVTGKLRGFSKVTRDITERKHNEEKLRKWGDIFQHTSQGLLIATPGNELLELINPALAKMHGYTVEELTGRPFTDLIAPECLTSVLERIHQSLSQEYYSLEAKHIRKDKTVFPALVGVNNVRDEQGKIAYIITNVQDITERKQAEIEIFNSLQKAIELNELKSRFIAMTSHEFRTPLATILSSTELLEYYSNKLPESEKQDLFKQIEAAIKRMTQLLEDVLVINKAEAGKLEFNPTPINLEKFCHELTTEMQLNAGNKHQIIFTHTGEYTNAVMDEKLLRHILTNLLTNALKYSPDGKNVEFELSCQNQQATFKIKDYGIGIPCEAHQKLFESFHRAKNVGNIQGTGSGLFITKKMVDLHQGSINFISELGIGTTFTVNLPLNLQVSINEQNFSN